MRRDEFEGRNRQRPADLDQSRLYQRSNTSREEMQRTPLGTPPDCYDVRSVYDTRPLNAYDFNIAGSVSLPYPVGIVEMTVPEGAVCVLRELSIWFEPAPPGSERSDNVASLLLNGADYPYNNAIPIGDDSGRFPVFMLADEFNRVGVRVNLTNPYPSTPGTAWVLFYGQFLLKSGRPLPTEIANPIMGGKCGQSIPVPRTGMPTASPPVPQTLVVNKPPPPPPPPKTAALRLKR